MAAESATPLAASRPKTVALHRRAVDDLRFIRETMAAGAVGYTTFSGYGLMLIGLGALISGTIAGRFPLGPMRTETWLVDACASLLIGTIAVTIKARRASQSLSAGPVRKFSVAFLPSILAGAALTIVLMQHGLWNWLPGVWLLLYGAALFSAGASSVALVPLTGAAFFVLGCCALWGSADRGNGLMTLGFGGLHLLSGFLIVRRHGG